MFQKNSLTIQNNKFGKNGVFPAESAVFNISVNTERWDENSKIWKYGKDFLSVRYSFEIIIDEHSGEDSLPADRRRWLNIQYIPKEPLSSV